MCLLLVFYAYDKKSRMHIENLMPVPNKINLPPYYLINTKINKLVWLCVACRSNKPKDELVASL
jgi:hypothetical protein